MTKMLAHQILPRDGGPIHLLHRNVMMVYSDKPNRVKYKCFDCGQEWYAEINAPVILPDESYITPNMKECTEFWPNKHLTKAEFVMKYVPADGAKLEPSAGFMKITHKCGCILTQTAGRKDWASLCPEHERQYNQLVQEERL